MDLIDTCMFVGWSCVLVYVADAGPTGLIIAQTAWLLIAWAGRRIIDIRFERREG
jgi:hypothetical protein